MSIELAVTLDKHGVFYAGETLSCELTFSYPYRRPLFSSGQTGHGTSITATLLEQRDSINDVSDEATRRSSLTSQTSSAAFYSTMISSADSTMTPGTSVANSPAPSIIEKSIGFAGSTEDTASTLQGDDGTETVYSSSASLDTSSLPASIQGKTN
jgi:hypothetical protein